MCVGLFSLCLQTKEGSGACSYMSDTVYVLDGLISAGACCHAHSPAQAYRAEAHEPMHRELQGNAERDVRSVLELEQDPQALQDNSTV